MVCKAERLLKTGELEVCERADEHELGGVHKWIRAVFA
jgi:hypothetical protein